MNIHKYINKYFKPQEFEFLIIITGTGIGSYIGHILMKLTILPNADLNGFKLGWLSSILIVSYFHFKKK